MILLTALIKIAVFLLVAAAIAFGLEYIGTVVRRGTSRLTPTLRHEKPTQTDDPPPPNSTT
jgi:hypothetical protein